MPQPFLSAYSEVVDVNRRWTPDWYAWVTSVRRLVDEDTSGTLVLRDSDDTNDLTIELGSDLTADHTLTIITGDADRTLTLAGDATISGTNTGDQTITLTGDVTGTGTGSFTATIAVNTVDNTKLTDMAAARFKARVTGSGDPEDITGTQATTLLDLFTSALKGLVPASGGGATDFLNAAGSWTMPVPAAAQAKAWALITWAAGVPALTTGYNVSASITDTAAGDFTITYSTPFSSATAYAPVAQGHAAAGGVRSMTVHTMTASTTRFHVRDDAGNLIDPVAVSIHVFGEP